MKIPQTRFRIPSFYGDNDWHVANLPDYPLSKQNPITDGVVRLNYQWQLLDQSSYDQTVASEAGVGYYVVKSFSNYHIHSSQSIMFIDILTNNTLAFKAMARSEINSDYVLVTLDGTTIFNGQGKSTFQSFSVSNALGKTMVVTYRKDGSVSTEPDRGYLAVPSSVSQVKD